MIAIFILVMFIVILFLLSILAKTGKVNSLFSVNGLLPIIRGREVTEEEEADFTSKLCFWLAIGFAGGLILLLVFM